MVVFYTAVNYYDWILFISFNNVCYVSFQEREKKEEEERIRMENIMTGNPLLNTQNNFKVKRRYNSTMRTYQKNGVKNVQQTTTWASMQRCLHQTHSCVHFINRLTNSLICIIGFSICINCLQWSFISLYFYTLFSCFPLLTHPAWCLGILRSLKKLGREMSEIHESE